MKIFSQIKLKQRHSRFFLIQILEGFSKPLFLFSAFILANCSFSTLSFAQVQNACGVYTSAAADAVIGYQISGCTVDANVGVQIRAPGSASLNLYNGTPSSSGGNISGVNLYQAINIEGDNLRVGDVINYGTLSSGRTSSFASSGVFFTGTNPTIDAIINASSGVIRSANTDVLIGVLPAAIEIITPASGTATGNVGLILNQGIIAGATAASGINNQSTIAKLINTGTISTSGTTANGYFGYKGYSSGASGYGNIGTLSNAQGAGNVAGPLTYSGNLPSNYNIIVSSPSTYGQLKVFSTSLVPYGTMSFGVFGGDSYVGNNGDTFTIAKSTLGVGTYNNVLQGLNGTLSGSTITGTNWSVTNTTGNFTNLNGAPFSYSLAAAADAGSWNLVVLSTATNISGVGTVYQSSNVGISVNPVFDGGTLQMAAGSISSNFTVNANNGVIDQNSVASTFSGIISDAVTGTPGSIAVTNSGSGGSVTFSEVNTFTGSTTIGSGATLALSGSGSISTSSSVANSGTFNISNTTSGASVSAIAGSGTVALGTKVLTITNASGNLSGVVSGSGGLNITGGSQTLSAANTFTGSTTIGSGATLVLSGVGSIAPTSAITNNGTFNIQPKSSNISINGNYVQSSSGSLQMGLTDTNNPKLLVGGTSSLAGSLLVTAGSGIYSAGRYTLITSTGTLSGTFGSFSYLSSVAPSFGYALEYDTNNVYLSLTSLGPSSLDTQSALELSAQRLKGIYNLQSTAVVNGLTYDCQLFDANNICLSTGGRYSNNHGTSGYTTSALLIGAYRLNKNVRLGAWVDQNLSTNTVTGTKLSNSKPLFGVFGAWAENPSGEGYEVKVSAGYGDKDLTVTRDVIGTSEAGAGTTRLNSQAISTVSSYGFKLNNDVIASPYVGVQYSRVASSAYTETTTVDVKAPLTYGRLSQENISVLAGLKLSAKLDPKTALFGSAGIEQNINNRSGQYSATGVDGLTSIEFNSNVQKTRATASAGISYDIDKKQRVSLSGIYREEAFSPTATTSVLATYTVGL